MAVRSKRPRAKLDERSALPRGSTRRARRLPVAAATALILAAAPASAGTPVFCVSPDDFCTGDPCTVTESLEIMVASCVLDFGSRALVLERRIDMPDTGGTLSLTAGSIAVEHWLRGRSEGDPVSISLTATGDITVGYRARVEARGGSGPSAILIDAGGNVVLNGELRTRAKIGSGMPGGAVTIDAGGSVSSAKSGEIDARGRPSTTSGGTVNITGQGDVGLLGRIDARGNPGGTVNISSVAADVSLGEQVRVEGCCRTGVGGSVDIDADGDLAVAKKAKIRANGRHASAGTISLTAGGTLDAYLLQAEGSHGPGGNIAVLAGTAAVQVIKASGNPGGAIDVESTVGDTTLKRVIARGATSAGGALTADSAANMTVAGNVRLDGKTAGGEMRLAAAANMVVGLDEGAGLSATGDTGGVLEGQAGGDLTARGQFKAASGGCIGLAAGGTLDTSLASFDVPLAGSCP